MIKKVCTKLKRFLLSTFQNIAGISAAVFLLFFAEPFVVEFMEKTPEEIQPVFENKLFDEPVFEWIEPDIPWEYQIKDVPHIKQGDDYPTGCESVSAVMVLQYFGYDISPDEFIDDYLPKMDTYAEGEGEDRVIFAADPNEYFVGDPYDEHSIGCYAPVIADSLERCTDGDGCEIINATGSSIGELLREYILNDIPVIFWATMNMQPSREGTTWTIIDTDREFTWIAGEHCLVLIGYDHEYYYFSDPSCDEPVTSYKKDIVEKRYNELGQQCVVMKQKG